MKRFTAILFALLYVVSVSGTTFHVHFCGKQLQNISIAGFEHKGCCCGKTEMDSNCCSEKLISFKAGKEHKRIESTVTPVSIPKIFVSEIPAFLSQFSAQSFVKIIPDFHSPPIRAENNELLILNSTFRI